MGSGCARVESGPTGSALQHPRGEIPMKAHPILRTICHDCDLIELGAVLLPVLLALVVIVSYLLR
jgi:hypothetical protein